MSAGDVEGDGDLDVVRGHPALAVHAHQPDGSFPLEDPPVATGLHGVAVGNWDDDPEPELAIASASGVAVRDRVGGVWQAPIVVASDVPNARALHWCDQRGDAHPELIAIDYDAIRLYPNREAVGPGGSWLDGAGAVVLGGPTGDNWAPVACGDLDGDGGDDLVIRTYDKLAIIPHGAAAQTVLAQRPVPSGFTLADIDDDGRLDLLTTPSEPPWRVEVWHNRSTPGTFQLDAPTTLLTTTDVPLSLSTTRAPRPTVPPM